MTEHISHADYIAKQRQRVLSVCQSMLEGKTGIIEGCRKLRAFRGEIDIDDNDADILTFIGIDSETNHLPIGDERKHWASEALQKNDIEIGKCEAFFKDDAFQACKNLINKLRNG